MRVALLCVLSALLASASPLEDLASLRDTEPSCERESYSRSEWRVYEQDRLLKERVARHAGTESWYIRGDAPYADMTIEHTVSRHSAWRNGFCEIGKGRKQAVRSFVTDLNNLTLTNQATNSSKRELDADKWMDSVKRAFRCDYSRAVVTVKRDYNLYSPPEERGRLRAELEACAVR